MKNIGNQKPFYRCFRFFVNTFVISFSFLLTIAYADIEDLDHVQVDEGNRDPLLISLGSHCEPAHSLRFGALRKAAFPFDWIISFDGEALIEILKDDFHYFLDEQHFVSIEPVGALLNTYYHLEFLHDGDFRGNQFSDNFQKLKTKYQRRIDRFRNLENYKGKIYFIRSSYEYSTTDPHRVYKCEENIEISDAYAMRLYEVLKNRFPHVNFNLIIINPLNRDGIEIENLSESIQIVKINDYKDNRIAKNLLIDHLMTLN